MAKILKVGEEYPPMLSLSRGEEVITYAIGLLDKFRRQGIIQGGRYKLSPKGKRQFKYLVETGFSPTDDEMRRAAEVLKHDSIQDELVQDATGEENT